MKKTSGCGRLGIKMNRIWAAAFLCDAGDKSIPLFNLILLWRMAHPEHLLGMFSNEHEK